MSNIASPYTKEQLYQSFIKLALDKPIEQITVQNILDDCDIARSTFYRYFRDKYELMSSYCFDKIASLKDNYKMVNTTAYEMQCKVLRDTVNFVASNQEYFFCIAQYSGQNSLLEAFIQHGKNYYRELLSIILTDELCFAIDYHVYGESFIFLDWIKNEINLTSNEICKSILEVMPKKLSDSLNNLHY